jgi:hypothetical protein
MKKLTIDAEELISAIDGIGDEIEAFLDTETGEILLVFPEWMQEDIDDDPKDSIEAEPDRYLRIERISSQEAYQVMADFVETLPASPEREALERALNGRSPFRVFKNTLASYPERREDWFRYRDEAYAAYAVHWFEAEGIEAELKQRVFGQEEAESRDGI